ncbi:hypothetical protein ONE63_005323 [Megalurothrips usitatus]|uniref:Uncharacterized protein n=1 Tax=Megalurothrips usitatus TaxID=439358 RepID=A0AAV7XYI7_9NEOP|nr:hypothetical protein ONE63_005323 [Megalurothrips usitatus]
MDAERGANAEPLVGPWSRCTVLTVQPVQPVRQGQPAAGEDTLTTRQSRVDIKDGEHSMCIERMGMGDLEVLDVVDVADGSRATPRAVARAQTAQAAWQREPGPFRPAAMPSSSTMSYCFTEFGRSDSDSDDDGGLLDAVDVLASSEPYDGGDGSGAPTPANSPTPAAVLARSKLSIVNNVAVINFPGGGQSRGLPAETYNIPAEFPGVEDEDPDEDEVSRKAPTPDNTPERSPSEENQAAHMSRVGLEPGLLSALTGVARERGGECGTGSSTPTPDGSASSTPTGTLSGQGRGQEQAGGAVGTLGRVWSRLMGRAGNKSRSAVSAPAHACPSPPRRSSTSDDDEYLVDNRGEDHRLDVDSRVRLDGGADDPVVSYLVEEADDTVRPPGVPGDVTVEEVYDDDDGDDDDSETLREVEQAADVEFRSCSSPVAKPSGLLSRLFSRMKPRQPNKAVMRGVLGAHGAYGHGHGALPRIVSRWLRQGEGGGGAEGDAGEAGPGVALVGRSRAIPLPAQPVALYPPQPLTLQRPRRNPSASSKEDARPDKASGTDGGASGGGKHQEVKTSGGKEWADLGVQTDLTLLSFVDAAVKPLEVRNESRSRTRTSSPVSEVTDCV